MVGGQNKIRENVFEEISAEYQASTERKLKNFETDLRKSILKNREGLATEEVLTG